MTTSHHAQASKAGFSILNDACPDSTCPNLVDTTGRQWHPAKRGRITGRPPAVLGHLGIGADQWVNRVRAVRPEGGFCRAIGSEAALLDKASAIGQRWLRGLGIARSLAN